MKKAFILCLLFALNVLNSRAQIVLPKLVSDNMVLQREQELQIWGWASPNENVTLELNGTQFYADANAQGEWQLILPKQKAGGPFDLIFTGQNKLVVRNVMFGDVWLAAGQSNMVHQLQHHDVTYAQDILEASNSNIRQFLVPNKPILSGPQQDFSGGSWKVANPENVREFSAVAYFFAQKIYEKEGIPIGIINASVGGTPIEAWTSKEGLSTFDDILKTIEKNESYKKPALLPSNKKIEIKDKGITSPTKWYDPNYIPTNWRNFTVPGYWEDQGLKDLNGTVWFRKEVNIPSSLIDTEAKIFMGRIIDADEVYINGHKVGGRTYQYPQRIYSLPMGTLKKGENLIVVKVTNYSQKGGFVPDKPYYIANPIDTVSISGNWQYKVGEVFEPLEQSNRSNFSLQHQPTALFNGMIAPAQKYAIKGTIWYQGESNAGSPTAYEALQKAQILDWRKQFGQENMPFIYVQLPNFKEYTYHPTESDWAQLRESQRKAANLPNTAMAVAIDLGEWNDIHPDDKKTVGERVALLALQMVYKHKLIATGPTVKNVEQHGSKIHIYFDQVANGLISKDREPIRGFAVGDEDGKYTWTEAIVEGNHIVLKLSSSIIVSRIRYAWADNPDVNLYNTEGLPAIPFEWQLEKPTEIWHGKQAAVVLTYDDALNVHLDTAIPQLDQYGLKGTFYITASAPASKNRITEWRMAAQNGHELGNHTLYHPCDARKPGRDWLTKDRDLGQYTTERIVNEISMTNTFLYAIDGKKERTFAYTCGDTETEEGSFIDAIASQFVAMRGVEGKMHKHNDINLKNVYSYGINGHSGEELIELVKTAQKENALITFLFHGVGGEHSLNVSKEAHAKLVAYLGENKDTIWTTTMLKVAKHVKQNSIDKN